MYLPQSFAMLDAGQPVNWAHPLNRGLVSWWMVSPLGHPAYRGGSRLLDLCRRNHGTLTNGPTWQGASSRLGWGSLRFTGASSHRVVVPDANQLDFGTGDMTACGWIKAAAGTGFRTLVSKYNTGGRWTFTLCDTTRSFAIGSGVEGSLVFNTNDQSIGYSGLVLDDDVWHHIGFRRRSTTHELFIDGNLVQSGLMASQDVSGTSDLWIGGIATSGGLQFFTGQIDDVRVFAAWQNIGEIYRNSRVGYPGLLNRVRRVTWFVPGGGAFTITAESGTYAITGTAAALEFNRLITASFGTYTITGQAATLVYNRPISAEAGSFTITGQASTLGASRLIAAVSGSFVITGSAVTLLYARVFPAASGTYVISGQDATLTYEQPGVFTIAADAGAYTVTGQAAGLLAGRLIDAESGTYALTGTNASLEYGRVLAAAAAAYAFTGQAATLTADRLIAADGGTYAVTGTAASLERGFFITAAAGSYAITGTDAAFDRTYVLAAGTGAWTITGQTVTLTYGATELDIVYRFDLHFYVTRAFDLHIVQTESFDSRLG